MLILAGIYLFIYFVTTKLQNKVRLGVVKGYTHCRVNDSTLSHFTEKYHCDFHLGFKVNETLVVTFVNHAWLGLARNWICSAQKVGLVNKTLLISFEAGVCEQLAGAACYEYPNAAIGGATFGQQGYRNFVFKRTEVILKLLACGYTLIVVDADVVFLQNPLPYMQEKIDGKDIVFQTDSVSVSFVDNVLPYLFQYLCGGLIYTRSNWATRYLWMSILQFQKEYFWNDQAALNVCIRHHSQFVRWNVLSSDQFPNGPQYFMYWQRSSRNMMVHANHFTAKAEKMAHMVAANIWCDYGTAVEVCQSEVYKNKCTNDPVVPRWCLEFHDVCWEKYNVDIITEK